VGGNVLGALDGNTVASITERPKKGCQKATRVCALVGGKHPPWEAVFSSSCKGNKEIAAKNRQDRIEWMEESGATVGTREYRAKQQGTVVQVESFGRNEKK
jgi:hypothetical protein